MGFPCLMIWLATITGKTILDGGGSNFKDWKFYYFQIISLGWVKEFASSGMTHLVREKVLDCIMLSENET